MQSTSAVCNTQDRPGISMRRVWSVVLVACFLCLATRTSSSYQHKASKTLHMHKDAGSNGKTALKGKAKQIQEDAGLADDLLTILPKEEEGLEKTSRKMEQQIKETQRRLHQVTAERDKHSNFRFLAEADRVNMRASHLSNDVASTQKKLMSIIHDLASDGKAKNQAEKDALREEAHRLTSMMNKGAEDFEDLPDDIDSPPTTKAEKQSAKKRVSDKPESAAEKNPAATAGVQNSAPALQAKPSTPKGVEADSVVFSTSQDTPTSQDTHSTNATSMPASGGAAGNSTFTSGDQETPIVHRFNGLPERLEFSIGDFGTLECSCNFKQHTSCNSGAAKENPVGRPAIPPQLVGQDAETIEKHHHCFDGCQRKLCTAKQYDKSPKAWKKWQACVSECISVCYR